MDRNRWEEIKQELSLDYSVNDNKEDLIKEIEADLYITDEEEYQKCKNCNNSLLSDVLYIYEEGPYCKDCYNQIKGDSQ